MIVIKNQGQRGKKHNNGTLGTHLTICFSSASLQASLRSVNARYESK